MSNMKSLKKVQTYLLAECFNKLFIGGQFVDPIDGGKFPTYYPATGELLHELPQGKANDVEEAISAAENAWAEGTWAGMSATDRAEIVFKMAQGIEQFIYFEYRYDWLISANNMEENLISMSSDFPCLSIWIST